MSAQANSFLSLAETDRDPLTRQRQADYHRLAAQRDQNAPEPDPLTGQ